MKVRIVLRDGYGDRHGNLYKRGEVVDLPDVLAAKLLRTRIAEPVSGPEPLETAEAAPAPENTAKRTAKPRARKAK